MLYAKVTVGLPVSGPFDYIVPPGLAKNLKPGVRVWVNFGPRRLVGYVVGLTKQSEVKNLKPILGLIDSYPILDKELLLLTKKVADYYYCSWGEAIETALPEGLRKGKEIVLTGDTLLRRVSPADNSLLRRVSPASFLLHDLDGQARWSVYISEIKKTLENKLSVIILLPDIPEVLKAQSRINKELGISSQLLYRKQPGELEEWKRACCASAQVIVGTRSAVFAPVRDLGLLIIEAEENSVYKQDQVPHYHPLVAAFMRAKLEKSRIILGSCAPSLESYLLGKKRKIGYNLIPRKRLYPEIKIIDSRHMPFSAQNKRALLSKLLEDSFYAVLNEKGKSLLFLNRKGFATTATCQTCAKVLKCPACNTNLVYHFKESLLSCHYCSFKMQVPEICPACNSGYIKFSGLGTEKVESELSRIFPQARIKILKDNDPVLADADIFISTSSIIRHTNLEFDLIGILGIDNTLNRPDLRATEKAFGLLAGLLCLTHKKIIIQTSSPGHHCFQALLKKDAGYFYKEELKQRKQLGFPPYSHLILVKLRGKNEEKVKEAAEKLFNKFKDDFKDKGINILSLNPSNPPKLRGNFCWQVLIRCRSVFTANTFLKNSLKDFRHSGIIVTVDVDPA